MASDVCNACIHYSVCAFNKEFNAYKAYIADKDKEVNKNPRFQVETLCTAFKSVYPNRSNSMQTYS